MTMGRILCEVEKVIHRQQSVVCMFQSYQHARGLTAVFHVNLVLPAVSPILRLHLSIYWCHYFLEKMLVAIDV